MAATDSEWGLFADHSAGIKSNRDAWAYNYGREAVLFNMQRLVTNYMELQNSGITITSPEANDPTRINWDMTLRNRFSRALPVSVSADDVRLSSYRPFSKAFVVLRAELLYSTTTMSTTFPKDSTENTAIVITGRSSHHPFSALMVRLMPDVHTLDSGQFFARYQYKPIDDGSLLHIGSQIEVVDEYRKIDNITDEALERFVAAYGGATTKDDVFFYVYGLLHTPGYRATYFADLKKMLPRIPLVSDAELFIAAGKKLAQLHLDYESVTPYPLDGLESEPSSGTDPFDYYRTEKMRFGRPSAAQRAAGLRADRSAIVYNQHITLHGIPDDAYRYQLGARSAIDWIIDRYQVKVDKPSGIRNDPNDWSRGQGDPRYILDLVARIVTVGLETVNIVDGLTKLSIEPRQ
jgi:predicted helicase